MLSTAISVSEARPPVSAKVIPPRAERAQSSSIRISVTSPLPSLCSTCVRVRRHPCGHSAPRNGSVPQSSFEAEGRAGDDASLVKSTQLVISPASGHISAREARRTARCSTESRAPRSKWPEAKGTAQRRDLGQVSRAPLPVCARTGPLGGHMSHRRRGAVRRGPSLRQA